MNFTGGFLLSNYNAINSQNMFVNDIEKNLNHNQENYEMVNR